MAELASELGAANVTVADVVARSGVSRRTFYEHFAGREECFLAALDAAIERVAARVAPAYKSHERWRERIRASLVELLALFDEEPHLARLLIVQALGAGREVLGRRRRVMATVVAAIGVDRGESKSGELPPLTAEGVVGAVFSVIHARLLASRDTSLLELTNELMSLIVLPYLGVAAARRELARPVPPARPVAAGGFGPLRVLDMRLTYRTVCVLLAIGSRPGASNREVGDMAGIHDQGQVSKLLRRLEDLGLVGNAGEGRLKGGRNAWTLTERGAAVRAAISVQRQLA